MPTVSSGVSVMGFSSIHGTGDYYVLMTTPSNVYTDVVLSGSRTVDYDSLGRIRFIYPGRFLVTYCVNLSPTSSNVFFDTANDEGMTIVEISRVEVQYGKNMFYVIDVTCPDPGMLLTVLLSDAVGTSAFLLSLTVAVI